MFHSNTLKRFGFTIRILFWLIILGCLVFAELIYKYISAHNLTDTSPLSLADVILVTGVIFSLFLIMRIYNKVDNLEKRLSELHQKLSIIHSDKP